MYERTTSDEYDLIRRCLAGDTDRFSVLVDRYKSMMYSIAYRMLGDQDAANDMAQESFIAAFTGLGNFQ
ncbi:MAG TPA: sigma factor, partial [Nitrospirota bacterium]|nr:sigma factor [Nitrospirota bacterium]